MADVLTKKQRSFNMASISSKNTEPELLLRRTLILHGYKGYRIHYPLIGKPDIVFLRKKLAIFVDGCFWHGCQRCFRTPATRKKFWVNKIQGNKKRDLKVNKELTEQGWSTLRFWEHDIKQQPDSCLDSIAIRLIST